MARSRAAWAIVPPPGDESPGYVAAPPEGGFKPASSTLRPPGAKRSREGCSREGCQPLISGGFNPRSAAPGIPKPQRGRRMEASDVSRCGTRAGVGKSGCGNPEIPPAPLQGAERMERPAPGVETPGFTPSSPAGSLVF